METGRTEILKVSGLSQSFGKLAVLKDVSFNIYSREIICLLGPSGCGKTTLLRLLAGLLTVQRGRIRFDGREANDGSLNGEVGMVFQEPRLLPWRTTAGNVALPFELRGGVGDSSVKEKVDVALDTVGLRDFKGNYPNELSGGMRQRVSLARALVMDPGVLFMDEPLSGLDVHSRKDFTGQILRVWSDKQLTLLWVTHDLPEAIHIADRIIVLSKRPGTVIADLRVPHPRNGQTAGGEEIELETTLRKLFE